MPAAIFGFIVPIILIVLIILILAANIRVVQQSKAYVIERLGAFHSVWGVGIHFKIPFIERVAKAVSLKEQVADFDPQPVITKDNVTMQIDTVIYFQITDPKLYTYGVEHPMSAIENLTATTLRNIIGDLELDQTLTSRDHINTKMRSLLDEATDPWGIKVNRVELKNILPPREIQDAMEKQMKAERERRESILQAEGQKQSQILVAEGEKQSLILRAEAAKQAAIRKAEGEKEARIMAADAEAQAIMKVQQATADAIKLLNEANPNGQVVKLKALEAMEKVADGKATKIIIPSEIQGLAGLAASAKALLETDPELQNVLTYGVEGQHYELVPYTTDDNETYDQVKLLEGSNYITKREYTGNAFQCYTMVGEDPLMWEKMKKQNLASVSAVDLGFGFSYVTLTNGDEKIQEPDYIEILESVIAKHYNEYMTGTAGKLNYDAYRAANDATVRQALRDQLAEEYNEMLSAQYTDEIRASYEEGTENYNTLMAQAEEAALDSLATALKRTLRTEFATDTQISVLDYTNEVSLYLDAADLLFTKPGGLSSTEAAVKGIPMVHTAPIPGWESDNAAFFEALGLSRTGDTPLLQADQAALLLASPAAMERMRERQRREINPHAAEDISALLLERAEADVPGERVI